MKIFLCFFFFFFNVWCFFLLSACCCKIVCASHSLISAVLFILCFFFFFFFFLRTWLSYVLTILLAQNPILPLLRPHTHEWPLYITPSEILDVANRHALTTDTSDYRGIALRLSPWGFLTHWPLKLWPHGAYFVEDLDHISESYMGEIWKPK